MKTHTQLEPPPPSSPRRTKSAVSATSTTSAAAALHRRSLSAIPFSWEKHPGIAKHFTNTNTNNNNINSSKSSSLVTFSSPLPPPPPMSKKNFSSTKPAMNDPFEAALSECARDPGTPPGLMEEIWGRKVVERNKRSSWRYNSSCKSSWACSVSESAVRVPRTGIQNPSFRVINRRIV